MSDQDLEQEKEEVRIIADAAAKLGWGTIAIPGVEEDAAVPGMVVGTSDYVMKVVEAADKVTDLENTLKYLRKMYNNPWMKEVVNSALRGDMSWYDGEPQELPDFYEQ